MHCFFQVTLHGTAMAITGYDVMITSWCILYKIHFKVLYNIMPFIDSVLFGY